MLETTLVNMKVVFCKHPVPQMLTAVHTIAVSVPVRVQCLSGASHLAGGSPNFLQNENKCTYDFCQATFIKPLKERVDIKNH